MLAGHYLRASGDLTFIKKSWPHLKNAMLVAVTEMNTREQIDGFVKALGQAKSGKRKAESRKKRQN
jgi:glycine cleavage system protein P-like pyridoxal-binding family